MRIGASKDGVELEAKNVVLATGSVAKPLLDLKFGGRVLDTAATWLLNEQPSRLCVIGAGASGTEVASAFGRLGTEVVLLEALDQILPLEDKEIARTCAREVAKQNVRIETGASVESAEPSDDGVSVTFNGETEQFDYLCIAAGRAPDLEELGLDDAGVKPDDSGRIEVDGNLRTSREGVYAIGDMVPGPAAGPQGLRRGHHRRGDRRRPRPAPDRLPVRPGRDLLPPPGRLVRADRAGGQGRGLRRGGRQGADGRRRRADRLRRPRRHGQDRRRQEVRRATGRPHLRAPRPPT